MVIGILIALSINNWNDKRIANNSYNIILESLITDLKNDVKELDNLALVSKNQNTSIVKILNHDEISIDSLEFVIMQLGFRPESFTPNTSSYNILENHGSFDLLKIKEVLTEVQSLYNSAIKINQESYSDRNSLIAQKIRLIIMKSGLLYIDLNKNITIDKEDSLIALFLNEELRGHLKELFIINDILITKRLDPLNAKFKDVAARLKNFIKN